MTFAGIDNMGCNPKTKIVELPVSGARSECLKFPELRAHPFPGVISYRWPVLFAGKETACSGSRR